MKTYTTPIIEIVTLKLRHDIMLDGTLSIKSMNEKPMQDVDGDETNVSPIWDNNE